jgi:hypothetical protein
MYFKGDLDWTDADWEITSEDVKKYYKYLEKFKYLFISKNILIKQININAQLFHACIAK